MGSFSNIFRHAKSSKQGNNNEDIIFNNGVCIIGAMIGDIVGSIYEFKNHRSTEFTLFSEKCHFTDDTVMTAAVADWLIKGGSLSDIMRSWGRIYPTRGYGRMFYRWLTSPYEADRKPYNSCGNGSAMRVSPCGFWAKSLDEALELAKLSAEVSHNHPEGIKGAQAVAAAIFMARQKSSKEEIKSYIEQTFGYNLSRTCDEIRPTYLFNSTCQGTCPEAIIAFLESHDFESAIRLAISLGGDSDTLAAITGGIAAAYYGIPQKIVLQATLYLSDQILDVIEQFENSENNRE